mgnify:CR=1 FL=1
MSAKKYVPIGNILPPMPCSWSVGPYMERFYQDLGEKKFTGVKCKCGRVSVPPRKLCPACGKVMEKFVVVKPTGELVNFTVAYQNVAGQRRKTPVIIGLVKLAGADTALIGEVRGLDPAAVKTGIKVKAVWADKPGNTVESLSHFAPVEG